MVIDLVSSTSSLSWLRLKIYALFSRFIGIEDVIVSKRKYQYEEEIKENPSNYDAWFDYLKLVESEGNNDVTREIYERAIFNVPPTNDKEFWRRYIYLWINYALFEELEAKDMEKCRQVYKYVMKANNNSNMLLFL